MMKKLLVLSLLLLLPLTGCQKNPVTTKKESTTTEIIAKNQQKFQKAQKNTSVIHTNDFTGDYLGPASTLTELLENRSKGYAVIKGTVYNLESMSEPKNMVWTKTSIRVDQVLTGKKSLKGKTLQVPLKGGLSTTDEYYQDMKKPDKNQKILVQNDMAPLPKIGSQVIIRLEKVDLTKESDYTNYLKNSGFKESTAYNPFYEQSNLWIKEPGKKKFVLNSSLIKHQQKTNGMDYAAGMEKLTKEINAKYNK